MSSKLLAAMDVIADLLCDDSLQGVAYRLSRKLETGFSAEERAEIFLQENGYDELKDKALSAISDDAPTRIKVIEVYCVCGRTTKISDDTCAICSGNGCFSDADYHTGEQVQVECENCYGTGKISPDQVTNGQPISDDAGVK